MQTRIAFLLLLVVVLLASPLTLAAKKGGKGKGGKNKGGKGKSSKAKCPSGKAGKACRAAAKGGSTKGATKGGVSFKSCDEATPALLQIQSSGICGKLFKTLSASGSSCPKLSDVTTCGKQVNDKVKAALKVCKGAQKQLIKAGLKAVKDQVNGAGKCPDEAKAFLSSANI